MIFPVEESGVIKLTTVILGGLSVLLVMVIIGLVVQNRKLQTGILFSYCVYHVFDFVVVENSLKFE